MVEAFIHEAKQFLKKNRNFATLLPSSSFHRNTQKIHIRGFGWYLDSVFFVILHYVELFHTPNNEIWRNYGKSVSFSKIQKIIKCV